jgi:DNA-directed RNA polymerase specialized sigma24 family protein
MLIDSTARKNVFERTSKLFFFCFLNESWALKTAKQVTMDLVRPPFLSLNTEQAEAVQLKQINKFYIEQSKRKHHQGTTPVLGHFEVPKTLDLGAWREFRRSSPSEEFYVTCLFYIGGFSLETISEVLKITVGTAKLRLSRGVKKLGSILLKEYLY